MMSAHPQEPGKPVTRTSQGSRSRQAKRLSARVEAVLIAPNPKTFVTHSVDEITLDLGGVLGDRHYGLTRSAGVREPMHPRGAEIRNRRQVSVVSVEDCQSIAHALELDAILPEWLGANLLLQGLPNLALLPCGTRLLFSGGTCLICEGENKPCRQPGKVIESLYPGDRNLPQAFVRAAKQRRGIVCSVERSGIIRRGDSLKILLS